MCVCAHTAGRPVKWNGRSLDWKERGGGRTLKVCNVFGWRIGWAARREVKLRESGYVTVLLGSNRRKMRLGERRQTREREKGDSF